MKALLWHIPRQEAFNLKLKSIYRPLSWGLNCIIFYSAKQEGTIIKTKSWKVKVALWVHHYNMMLYSSLTFVIDYIYCSLLLQAFSVPYTFLVWKIKISTKYCIFKHKARDNSENPSQTATSKMVASLRSMFWAIYLLVEKIKISSSKYDIFNHNSIIALCQK